MNDKERTILWIDDDVNTEDGQDIIKSAKKHGIDLKGFECGFDGIEDLKDKYSEYDGVLLDAKTKYNSDDADHTQNLGKIKKELTRLFANRREKPIFILTGKAPNIQDYHSEVVYKKNDLLIEKDFSIWNHFKLEIQEYRSCILKDKYLDILSVGDKISPECKKRILELVMHLDGSSINNPFVQIRKILDSIFLYLNKIGKGTDKYINKKNSVNLTWAFHYFQYNQKKSFLNKKTNTYQFYIPKKPDFMPLSIKNKETDKYEHYINNNPWPTDISEIAHVLLGDGTPVQGLGHVQGKVKDSENYHFQNVRDNIYFSYAYINLLFTFLLWFNQEYLNE